MQESTRGAGCWCVRRTLAAATKRSSTHTNTDELSSMALMARDGDERRLLATENEGREVKSGGELTGRALVYSFLLGGDRGRRN